MNYLMLILLLTGPVMAQDSATASTTDNNVSAEIGAVKTGDERTDDPAAADQDFKPEQEISEDYPIPLPADI